MKQAGLIIGFVVVIVLAALLFAGNPGGYHLREFERIKSNFNSYSPSLADRLKGISDNHTKWNYHLRKLEELGVVDHKSFVFTNVPYTLESSRCIFRAACSNFPRAVMFSANYYATNDAGYGVRPYALEVWDFPSNMARWSLFIEANNHPQ